MADPFREPVDSPLLGEDFTWIRQDPRRRVLSMPCRLPKCGAPVTRKPRGRVALFCSAEHSKLYAKRRDALMALRAELRTALAENSASACRPSTRAGRRLVSDLNYVHYLLKAFPNLDLPTVPRSGHSAGGARQT